MSHIPRQKRVLDSPDFAHSMRFFFLCIFLSFYNCKYIFFTIYIKIRLLAEELQVEGFQSRRSRQAHSLRTFHKIRILAQLLLI
jgi:hypothetical protein